MPDTPDAITLTYSLDARAYLGAVFRLVLPASGRIALMVFVALGGFSVLFTLAFGSASALPRSLVLSAFVSVFTASLLLALSMFNVYRALRRDPERFALGEVRLTLGHRGVEVLAGRAHSSLGWVYIQRLWVTRRWLFLLTDRYQGIPVPRAAIGDAAAVAALCARVEALRVAGRDAEAAVARPDVAVQPEETAPWQLTFANETADWVALTRWRLRQRGRSRWVASALGVFVLLLGGCTGLLVLVVERQGAHGLAMIGLGLFGFLVGMSPWWGWWLVPYRVRRAMRRQPHRYSTAPRRLVVGEEGFAITLVDGRTELPWARLHEIGVDGHRIYLCLDAVHAYVVPPSAFESGADAERFASEAQAWLARAKTRPGRPRTDRRHDGPPSTRDDPFAPPSVR